MYGCHRPLVPPHLVKASFRMHAAMGVALPATVDLRETGLLPAIKNQGQTSACEGHSGSYAIEGAFALAGDPLGFTPSEDDLYKGLRSVERARHVPITVPIGLFPKLIDSGGMTEDCLTFLANVGIRPRRIAQTSDGRNSDVELSSVNENLTILDAETDASRLIVGPYAINPEASDAEYQVKAALASRILVRVDTFVDGPFEDWTPSQAPVGPPDENGGRGGGHAMVIVGYARGLYIAASSWGTNCGTEGYFYVSPAWLRSVWGLYPWSVSKS
jgi:hypothetical protein